MKGSQSFGLAHLAMKRNSMKPQFP
jgi:hypothetical protein